MEETDLTFLENRWLEIAPYATVVVDASGRIVSVNALAEQLFGYPPGMLAGEPLRALIPLHLQDQHDRHLIHYAGNPHPRAVGAGPALWAMRRDGSEFTAEITLKPIRTQAGMYTVAAIRDMTEYGHTRQSLQRTTTKLEQQLLIRNNELLQTNDELRQQIATRIQTEVALRQTEAQYQQLVENQPDLICRFLPDTTLTFVNRAYARFFGKQPNELIGSRFIDFLKDQEQEEVRSQLAAFTPETPERQYEHKTFRPDSTVCWHLWHDFALFDDQGQIVYFQSVGIDISTRKLAEDALFEEKERAQVTLHSIGDAVITTDDRAVVQYLNPVAEALTGWSSAEAQGRLLSEIFQIVNEDSREPALDPVARCLQYGKLIELANHTVLINRNGKEYDIADSAAPIRGRDGQILGVVLVFHDITATRKLARQLAHDATHDALTGLVNRVEFEKRVKRALTSARQYGARHALCYLDLDQFKLVNDTAGHTAGDNLLRQINGLISGLFRERDTLARIGGDEFGLLLDNCPLERASFIAQSVVRIIRDYRFQWEGAVYQIGVSIGLVPVTDQAISTTELLTQADVACYTAKRLGRNQVHIYQPTRSDQALHRNEILEAAALRDALEQDRFRLYYQPIVDLNDPAYPTVYYEVLLRVAQPDHAEESHELALPAVFIPAAERYGLMSAIDRWVIQTAFRDYAAWVGKTGVSISINLSSNSLGDESLCDYIETQFKESGFPPSQVCFEITETAAIQNLSRATQLATALKQRGCQLMLDNFGSGMSSFHYLKTLSVDYLKIDGSFIKDMIENPNDYALVAAINQMGHALGLRTIAEYTHSEAIVQQLQDLGVDYAQGYFFGKPAPWSPLV